MAVINTGLLTKGLRSEFFARFDATPKHYQELATRIVSHSDSETYRWLGTVPRMRQWGTGRLAKGLRSESYSLENLKYEATIEVDRDEIADDQTGQIRVRVAELAQRAATHKDYLVAELLINGESSGYNSYDGVPFLSDSHSSGASGSQDNKLEYGVSDADNATVAEFKAALKQAIAAMLAFKDDQGEPMLVSATGLTWRADAGQRDGSDVRRAAGDVLYGLRGDQRVDGGEHLERVGGCGQGYRLSVADRREQVVSAEDRRGGSAVHFPGPRAGGIRGAGRGQ